MQTLSTIILILLVLVTGLAGYYYLDTVVPMRKSVKQLEKENEYLNTQLDQVQIQSRDLARELENKVNEVAKDKNTEIQRLKSTYEDLITGLKDQISSGEISITQLADQLKVNIVDKVLFPSGKAELSERGQKVLLQVGAILQKAEEKNIKVEGHTDNVPIHPKLQSQFGSNWELSVIRATNVVRFLENEVKLDPGSLEASGFGPYRPVASNKTRRGRAWNRRIEILLLPKKQKLRLKANTRLTQGVVMSMIKVVQYGLGPIGLEAVRLMLSRKNVALAGIIDSDPAKAGCDVGSLLGIEKTNIVVSDDTEGVLGKVKPDVVVHCTNSFLKTIESQLGYCIRAGASVISSSEELFYPYKRDRDFCERIDNLCKQYGTSVVATGVNPGFSMDLLPVVMSSVCTAVNAVRAERIVDAGRRRLPLQKKVGAGLSPNVFRQKVKEGQLGHIGLVESLYAVADHLGFVLQDVDELIDPMIAERDLETGYTSIATGQVTGILHRASGFSGGEEKISLELQMFVGAGQERDSVIIDGTPPIRMNVEGGIFGDEATVARLVNAIPVVHSAVPGLLDIFKIPAVSFWS